MEQQGQQFDEFPLPLAQFIQGAGEACLIEGKEALFDRLEIKCGGLLGVGGLPCHTVIFIGAAPAFFKNLTRTSTWQRSHKYYCYI